MTMDSLAQSLTSEDLSSNLPANRKYPLKIKMACLLSSKYAIFTAGSRNSTDE